MLTTTYIEGRPSTADYLSLRHAAGWYAFDQERANASLNNSLYIIHVRCGNEVIGFGRVVGDGQAYFYIQDILVAPEFRRRGIGTQIVKQLMSYLDSVAPENSGAFIGLMIAPGLLEFYTKFGFQQFTEQKPALKIWRK